MAQVDLNIIVFSPYQHGTYMHFYGVCFTVSQTDLAAHKENKYKSVIHRSTFISSKISTRFYCFNQSL